jgi:uncharacterized protein Usg
MTALPTDALPRQAKSRVTQDFIRQLSGYGLTTAEILYRFPDHPHLIQSYIWQEYDVAPKFPVLKGFLAFWERELAGPLFQIKVAHERLIKPCEFRAVNGEFLLN